MTPREIERYTQANGHCSALIKLTGDFKELFMSHSSWFRYQAMTRIMKHCKPRGLGRARRIGCGDETVAIATTRLLLTFTAR